jgi:hypothetical protein
VPVTATGTPRWALDKPAVALSAVIVPVAVQAAVQETLTLRPLPATAASLAGPMAHFSEPTPPPPPPPLEPAPSTVSQLETVSTASTIALSWPMPQSTLSASPSRASMTSLPNGTLQE